MHGRVAGVVKILEATDPWCTWYDLELDRGGRVPTAKTAKKITNAETAIFFVDTAQTAEANFNSIR